ncbi:MAG: hypothetical protein LBJ20_07495 [Candidatus Methanoplasma sp.]|jgi:hypothetical protein|nr:hypothetical protein [Candidatus Methanoplasma sp.]
MATKSFYEMMVIDTDEKLDNMVQAFRDAEERGPYTSTVDVDAARRRAKNLSGPAF